MWNILVYFRRHYILLSGGEFDGDTVSNHTVCDYVVDMDDSIKVPTVPIIGMRLLRNNQQSRVIRRITQVKFVEITVFYYQ